MYSCILGDFSDYKVGCGTFDLVLADPPYGHIVKDPYDQITCQLLLSMLFEVTKFAMDALVEGGSLILFGGIGRHKYRPFLDFASTVESEIDNVHIRDFITWKKNRGYGCKTRYLFTREELLWITKGDKPSYFEKPYLEERHSDCTVAMLKGRKYQPHSKYKRRSNVWTDITEVMRGKVVSAQKPVELYNVIIRTHCPENGNIIDLFGGSGTSVISALGLDRNITIFEKDPDTYRKMVNHIDEKLKELDHSDKQLSFLVEK